MASNTGIPSFTLGAGANSNRTAGLPKQTKNSMLQGMLKRMLSTPAAPKVGGIPMLKNLPRAKTPKSAVGKVPF